MKLNDETGTEKKDKFCSWSERAKRGHLCVMQYIFKVQSVSHAMQTCQGSEASTAGKTPLDGEFLGAVNLSRRCIGCISLFSRGMKALTLFNRFDCILHTHACEERHMPQPPIGLHMHSQSSETQRTQNYSKKIWSFSIINFLRENSK